MEDGAHLLTRADFFRETEISRRSAMATRLTANAFRCRGHRERAQQLVALEDAEELIVNGYFEMEIGSHGGLRTSKAL